MTIKDALAKHLLASTPIAAVVGTRVYRGIVPAGTAAPFIEYRRVANTPNKSMSGFSGSTVPTFHISAVTASDLASEALAKLIFNRLFGFWSKNNGLMGGDGGVFVQSCFMIDQFDETFPNPQNASLQLLGNTGVYQIAHDDAPPTPDF